MTCCKVGSRERCCSAPHIRARTSCGTRDPPPSRVQSSGTSVGVTIQGALLCGFGLRRLIPQHLFRPDSKALRVEPERQCRESNLVLRASLMDRVAACVATTRYGAVASNHSRNFTRTGQQSDASTNVLLFAKRRRFAMRLVHHADSKWPSESDPLLVPTAIHKPTQGS
jgi:hypothetical protein